VFERHIAQCGGNRKVQGGGKLHDVNILDQLIAEATAFFATVLGYRISAIASPASGG